MVTVSSLGGLIASVVDPLSGCLTLFLLNLTT